MLHHHVRPLRLEEVVDLVFYVRILLRQLLKLVLPVDLLSLLLEGLLLASNKLLDVLFVVNLLHLLVLVTVVYGIVNSVLDYFIFNIFEHHVESVLDVVFCPARHLLYYFGPFVSDLEPLAQEVDILLQ